LKAVNGILEPLTSFDLKDEARSVSTSPDGSKALVVTSTGNGILLDLDKEGNSIKVSTRFKFSGIAKLAVFKSDSDFTILTNKGLGFYRAGNEIEQIRFTPGNFSTVSYSRSGKFYVAVANKVSVYSNSDNISEKPESVISLNSRITSLVISPSGDYLAAGTYDGGIYLRNLQTSKAAISFTPHASSVNDLKFKSVNGNLQLASVSSDQTIKIMDVNSIMVSNNTEDIITLRGHNKWVYSLMYSPDGKFLYTASEDKRIIGWHTSMSGIYKSLTSDKN
jgi:WD40 repeat protein